MELYTNDNILGDNIGYLKLVSVMGSDLQIVNDARVSYDNKKTTLDEKDTKLIKYLIKHKHTSPFRGCALKFEVKCPLFIARQWWKHHVSSNYVDSQDGWNEMSLRYTEGSEAYIPVEFRKQSSVNKQASEEHSFTNDELAELTYAYNHSIDKAIHAYHLLMKRGVCREQARGVLPAAIYTRFRWTTSLEGVLHFLSLRDSSNAQWEIQQYALAIKDAIKPSFPISLKYFLENS